MAILQLRFSNDAASRLRAVRLPLSKSIALRVMTLNGVASALGKEGTLIPQLPECGDIEGMERALKQFERSGIRLGNHADRNEEGKHIINIGEGGAPLRFFMALAAGSPGCDVTIHTSRGLMRRPLAILIDSLRRLGAEIHCLRRQGYPPLRIIGRKLEGVPITVNTGVSSQYISSLLMISSLMDSPPEIIFSGEKIVSTPYIKMTINVMERFGIKCCIKESPLPSIEISGDSRLSPPECFPIEPDWSAASYFYEVALLLPDRDIPIAALYPAAKSLQGDSKCSEIFGQIGVETTFLEDGSAILHCDSRLRDRFIRKGRPLEVDMNDTPDLVPAMTVGLAMSGIKFRFTSVGHLRHKETDRLTALASEMEKLGYMLEIDGETLSWRGERIAVDENILIKTYSDHRMAMAFAPAAIRFPYLSIENPEVIGKSYPGYWDALRGLSFDMKICEAMGMDNHDIAHSIKSD